MKTVMVMVMKSRMTMMMKNGVQLLLLCRRIILYFDGEENSWGDFQDEIDKEASLYNGKDEDSSINEDRSDDDWYESDDDWLENGGRKMVIVLKVMLYK